MGNTQFVGRLIVGTILAIVFSNSAPGGSVVTVQDCISQALQT